MKIKAERHGRFNLMIHGAGVWMLDFCGLIRSGGILIGYNPTLRMPTTQKIIEDSEI